MKQIATSLKIFKPAFFAVAVLLFSNAGWSQTIFTNPITGTDPSTANPFTTGQTTDPNVTASGIGRGPGINAVSALNRYNADGFATASTINLSDYFEFIITPNANYEIDFSSFAYTLRRSGTGPTTFVLRSSVDNFTADITTNTFATSNTTATPFTASLSGSSFQNIGSAITFRLYGYGATAAGGTAGIDDFTFSGPVALSTDLLSFTARTSGRNAQLSWTTSCASTIQTFAVEHSTDGSAFTETGRLDAATSECSNATRAYKFETPARSGLYRLAMHDASGRTSYSRALSVAAAAASQSSVRLYPSPAGSTLQVEGLQKGSTCRIVDATGRTLKAWTATGESEAVAVGTLSAGTYMLMSEAAGRSLTQRFSKN